MSAGRLRSVLKLRSKSVQIQEALRQALPKGSQSENGGANGVLKQNFQSFTQTLNNLPAWALNDLFAGLMAA
jgi:hypothetical protein